MSLPHKLYLQRVIVTKNTKDYKTVEGILYKYTKQSLVLSDSIQNPTSQIKIKLSNVNSIEFDNRFYWLPIF